MPQTEIQLPQLDRDILDTAAMYWNTTGELLAFVRKELGMSQRQYCRHLARLTRDPAALAYSPLLINRLRRIANERARATVMGNIYD